MAFFHYASRLSHLEEHMGCISMEWFPTDETDYTFAVFALATCNPWRSQRMVSHDVIQGYFCEGSCAAFKQMPFLVPNPPPLAL